MRRSAVHYLCLLALVLSAAVGRAGESLVGGLYVETQPQGASIYVGGELVGVSPCGVPEVGIGAVEVEARKKGYGKARKTVTIKADQVERVRLTLKELNQVGSIVVMVEPAGSRVRVDRVPFGKTPCRINNIEARTHRVEVTRKGYRPLVENVSVTAGKTQVVKGKLVEGGGWLGGEDGEKQEVGFEDMKAEDVPLPEEMPEAKAFGPVRKLLEERKYDQALQVLEDMAGNSKMRKYGARIARDRRYIRQVKDVVAAGYKGFKRKIGQTYPVPLKGGITVKGEVKEVTGEHLILDYRGATKRIKLDQVHVDRVVKLAAAEFSPDQGRNQALFALLYAMEGEYDEALEAMQRAARIGYNVTEVKSFVESEKMWDAALKKKAGEERKAREKEQIEKAREEVSGKPKKREPMVMLDRYRGGWLSDEVRGPMKKAGLEVKWGSREKKVTELNLENCAVYGIIDRGEADYIPPFEKAEIERLVRFVESGGGLVFFVHLLHREQNKDTPFDPLLSAFKMAVKPDRLDVHPKAPHPKHLVPARPVGRHHITRGVREVSFRKTSPLLVAQKNAWVLSSSKYVKSKATGRRPVPLLAARQVGKGRVVVFASQPLIWDEDTGVQAVRLIVNAFRWAAYPSLHGGED